MSIFCTDCHKVTWRVVLLQRGAQTLSFIASASVHPLSCVLFGTLCYRCSENVLGRRNRDRGGGLKCRYTPSPEPPPLQVCVRLPGFFPLLLYEGEIFLNAKLPRRASPTRPRRSIRRAKIQTWQNWKISHGRFSWADALISRRRHMTEAGFPAIHGSCHFCAAQPQS